MESVAGLVQQGAHVVVDAYGIHEDERHLAERERLAVAARSLALAVVQVEQIGVRHAAVVAAELRVDVGEHVTGSIDECRDVFERLQRRAPPGIGGYIPWPHGVEAHLTLPPPHEALHGR